MSKVTIIVPIYNVEEYVEKCIKSLMMQTFADISIWAISDGSKDNSMKIVDELAKKDKRIKSIKKENGGYGSVLEYAIKNISTEYFLICDPDDWLEEDAIEKLYNKALEKNVDLVVGEKYFVYQNKNDKTKENGYMPFYKLENDVKTENLENFVFMSVTPHAKLYKTKFAKDIIFSHHVSYTDTTLYLIYLTKIKSAIYINEPLANYYIDRPGNTSGELERLSQKAFKHMMIVLNSIYDQLDKNSNLYYCICYRLYVLLLFVIKRMPKNIDKKELNDNIEEIVAFLNKIREGKKNFKKYIKAENFLKTIAKKIMCMLIFNRVLMKKILSIMIKISK